MIVSSLAYMNSFGRTKPSEELGEAIQEILREKYREAYLGGYIRKRKRKTKKENKTKNLIVKPIKYLCMSYTRMDINELWYSGWFLLQQA